MSNPTAKLQSSIDITVDGAPRTILMSFALVNRVCYLMGDSINIPLLLQDAELRGAVLVEALAERDAKGKIINKFGIDEMLISYDDIQNVLELVSEHVADFSMEAAERAQRLLAKNQARLNAISKGSSSTPTPAGPGA